MKTEKTWKDKIRPHRIKKLFPPRISRDLEIIDTKGINVRTVDYNKGQGAYIHGELGSGKTILACIMQLEYEKQMYLTGGTNPCNSKFVVVPELFDRLKHAMFSDDSEHNQYMIKQEYQQAGLLVLDEIGMSNKPSDWLLDTLYSVVNHRYDNLLPTIYTSNISLERLGEQLGDQRISSRIDRNCIIVKKKHWND